MKLVELGLLVVVTAGSVLGALLVWLRSTRREAPQGTGRPLESTEIRYFRVEGAAERYVGIVSGDLRRVRCAEVWVNSENTNMQMARFEEFSISSIIRYEAAELDPSGRVVQDPITDELRRRTAGRLPLPAATAVTTGAGRLSRNGVRRVVHVASVQGEPGSGFRQVREPGRCVTNVLAEVERLTPPLASVLFPLLGVGHGGGSLEFTVSAMLGAIIDHYRLTPSGHVKIVYLLAYTDRELSVCTRLLGRNRHLRGLDSSPPGITAAPDSDAAAPDSGGATPDSGPAGSAAALGPGPAGGPATNAAVRKHLQMGFTVDVMGYGARSGPAQEKVQERLARLVHVALLDCGTSLDEVGHQWAGDGFSAFLPSDTDPTTALPALLRSITDHLTTDNHDAQDRIRLRMAVGIGVVGPGATGFSGSIIVNIHRLVDSPLLRTAAAHSPTADLVALVSDHLHDYVIKPGYPGLSPTDFKEVRIEVKEFAERAWLWTPTQ